MISLLIVDDQPLIRAAIRDLVVDQPDIEIVGEAGDGTEALRLASTTRPDVILMDIRMPHLDGIAATKAIVDNHDLTGTRVLILTTFEEDENVLAALRAGASGFIGKGAEPGRRILETPFSPPPPPEPSSSDTSPPGPRRPSRHTTECSSSP